MVCGHNPAIRGRTRRSAPTERGHVLSVVFTENLGQVNIDITTDNGATVNYNSLNTPNGVNYYIPNTGSYIVYFTFSDGDEYYGFEVSPGTCMTLMTQDCPECSMEGVVLPPHNCGMDNEYEYEP